MAKAPTKTPYIKGSHGTKPTPTSIPAKPVVGLGQDLNVTGAGTVLPCSYDWFRRLI